MNPDRDLELDIAKFDLLWPLAYPLHSKIPFLSALIRNFVKDEVISTAHLWEKAISVQLNLIRESKIDKDFQTGEDCKLVSVRTSSYGGSYSAPITGINRKTGNLIVACYERKKKKWYFFKIPHEAYKDIPKTSNIEIPFEMDGTPRRTPLGARVYANWWDFECTFEQLGESNEESKH